jgi:hypothetical protein
MGKEKGKTDAAKLSRGVSWWSLAEMAHFLLGRHQDYLNFFYIFLDFVKLYDCFGIYQNYTTTVVTHSGCSETVVAYGGRD